MKHKQALSEKHPAVHLRGIALGFRNLTNYTIRGFIHAGRLKDHLAAIT